MASDTETTDQLIQRLSTSDIQTVLTPREIAAVEAWLSANPDSLSQRQKERLATGESAHHKLCLHLKAIFGFNRAVKTPTSTTPRSAPDSTRRFQIALSFPGDHRDFVAEVARHLSGHVGQERVLYDKYYEAVFARPNLDVYLPRLYREESELVVVFLCPEYKTKRWCKLEWRHIRQLITTADEDRIMLTSFGPPGDLSEIGILSGDGYVDIGSRDPATIANLILQRASGTPTSSARVSPPPPPAELHPAVALWQQKLDMLLVDEAKAVTTDMKFKIQQDIKEARAKIKNLGSES